MHLMRLCLAALLFVDSAAQEFPDAPQLQLTCEAEPGPEKKCSNATRVPRSFRYCAPAHNIEQRYVGARGIWEPDETAVFLKQLHTHPAAVVVDVGARHGWFTMLALSAAHRVIAIEAMSVSACYMVHNAKINGVRSRLFPINRPIGDVSNTPVRMHGIRASIDSNTTSSNKEPPLLTLTLNEIVPLLPAGKSVILQMDVESFECRALLGAAELLKHANVVAIMMEWSSPQHSGDFVNGCSWTLAFKQVRSQGLVPYRVIRHGGGRVEMLRGEHASWAAQGLTSGTVLWRR